VQSDHAKAAEDGMSASATIIFFIKNPSSFGWQSAQPLQVNGFAALNKSQIEECKKLRTV
jgi:hypothetical protein